MIGLRTRQHEIYQRAQTTMSSLLDSPFTVFVISLVAQGAAAYVGDFLTSGDRPWRETKALSSKRPL